MLKACAYDPKERYVSATDMLADLQALQKGVRIPVAPVAVAAVGSVYAAAEDLTEKMEPEEAEGTVNILNYFLQYPLKLIIKILLELQYLF